MPESPAFVWLKRGKWHTRYQIVKEQIGAYVLRRPINDRPFHDSIRFPSRVNGVSEKKLGANERPRRVGRFGVSVQGIRAFPVRDMQGLVGSRASGRWCSWGSRAIRRLVLPPLRGDAAAGGRPSPVVGPSAAA